MRAQRKALAPEEKAHASSDEIDLTAFIERLLASDCPVVAPRWNGETYELARLKSLRAEDLRTGPMGIRALDG